MYCRAYEWNAFTYFLLFDLFWWFKNSVLRQISFVRRHPKRRPCLPEKPLRLVGGWWATPVGHPCHHPTTRDGRVFILQKFDQVELNWRLPGIHIQLQSHLEPARVGSFCIGISPHFHLFEVLWSTTECLIPLWRMVRYRKKTHIKPTYPLAS